MQNNFTSKCLIKILGLAPVISSILNKFQYFSYFQELLLRNIHILRLSKFSIEPTSFRLTLFLKTCCPLQLCSNNCRYIINLNFSLKFNDSVTSYFSHISYIHISIIINIIYMFTVYMIYFFKSFPVILIPSQFTII